MSFFSSIARKAARKASLARGRINVAARNVASGPDLGRTAGQVAAGLPSYGRTFTHLTAIATHSDRTAIATGAVLTGAAVIGGISLAKRAW